jgi:hypothetical protein
MGNHPSVRETEPAAGGWIFHEIGFFDFMKNKILCVLGAFAVNMLPKYGMQQ